MGLRCSSCGMPIPTLGRVCPFCRTERDDIEAQAYGMGCALGLLSIGALVWFAFHDVQMALIAAGVGAVLGLIAVRGQMEKFLALALVFVVFGIPTLWMACPDPFFRRKPPDQPSPFNAGQRIPHPGFSLDEMRAKVKAGMSAEQVRSLVGDPPGGVKPPLDGDPNFEVWDYPNAKVYFHKGRDVAMVSNR